MTAQTATRDPNEQNALEGFVAQQVSQRPLVMVGAVAVAGFLFGQFERSRSTRSSANAAINEGAAFGFASAAMNVASSSGSHPMSLQDFANRYSGS